MQRAALLHAPIIGRPLTLAARLAIALRYYREPALAIGPWLFRSKETSNFTYDLEPLNARYLAAFVAQVTGIPRATILGYQRELAEDQALRAHILAAPLTDEQRAITDRTVRFGRRLGWYAIVRAAKPRLVVETGVDKGLGACVLAAALRRNAAEGAPGRYLGTDINPRAGFLLSGAYAEVGEIRYGDSIATLRTINEPIDIFINDSDHSAEYEGREYETVRDTLSPTAIILADNAHATDKLLAFADRTGRDFLFWKEQPAGHWYPGAGIGAAYTTPALTANP